MTMHEQGVVGASEARRPAGVTIAICTHNAEERILLAVKAIRDQVVSSDIQWELLIIDNASTDATSDAAEGVWNAAPATNMRILNEAKLGVANARALAIKEAKYEYLSFVDDDNIVCDAWVETVFKTFTANPTVALVHSCSVAGLDAPPPASFEFFKGWLAVGAMAEAEGVIRRRPISFWTAGLSLRLSALQFIHDPTYRLVFVGRQGAATTGGEDHEITLCVLLGGWDAYYCPMLSFVHKIPMRRLSKRYIRQLLVDSGRTYRILRLYRMACAGITPYEDRLEGLRLAYGLGLSAAKLAAKVLIFGGSSEEITPNHISFWLAFGRAAGFLSFSREVGQALKNIKVAGAQMRAADQGPAIGGGAA